MPLPAFFPVPRPVPHLSLDLGISLRELCAAAGVACRASGEWTRRLIEVSGAEAPYIEAEPLAWGRVRIGAPSGLDAQGRARYALGAMAYALMDGVARESICGAPWASIDRRGRPQGRAAPKSNRQRQHEWRRRQANNTAA